jgi:hypothetical protein
VGERWKKYRKARIDECGNVRALAQRTKNSRKLGEGQK